MKERLLRYVFDDCILDTDRHTLLRQAQPVRLQPRVFRMLAYLLEHHQRVVPRQELFEQVWQGEYVSKVTLDGCIKQVRQAIGDSGRTQRLLKTQHGVGYQLVAPVSVQDAANTEDVAELSSPERVVSPPSASPPRLTERRQLTVLSGALAAAPYLFGHLDTDDLHRVLRAFHSLCADTVAPFGGTVAQRIDDHCLIYFGYPQAHGDDARRAVLAALHLLEATRSGLSTLTPWLEGTGGIKVGIHSGEVVIDSADDSGGVLVLGSVATLASALRDVAEPQTVVISADTASLVDGYFTCQSLAPVALPGRRDVMPVYRVTGASGAQMRLDLVSARRLTPFVGREPELALLTARWGQARDGRGQAVVVSGEAGIGKSRLLRTVAEQLVPGGAMEGRGSPYHQQRAFYALAEVLRHLLRLDASPLHDPLRQCEDVLQQYGLEAARHLPLIAPLLNLSLPPERYPDSPLSPQQKRQRTFESLLALVLGASKPLLLILEDLHWVDPSTLEWLGMLLEQLPTAEVLLLMTCRPEFAVPWASRSYLTQVTLDRLETPHSRRMVESIVRDHDLPVPLIEEIIAHSDGVPLFIEELSWAMLDTGMAQIPLTLQDTLTARLDQVGVAKRTAHLGAVLGRQFSDALLRAVSPLEEDDLRQDLRCLVDRELLHQRGVGNDATYLFKHALIQDAAYGSLLRRNRQQLHRRIAQVLETQFPLTQDTQPELLAHHYTEAGLHEQAVVWWQRAAQQSRARSADHEAAEYATKGLAVLSRLPESQSRMQQELKLLRVLGIAQVAIAGYAASEVEQTYTRAQVLCQNLDDPEQVFPILHGLRNFYLVRAELASASNIGKELLKIAQHLQSPELLLHAHMLHGHTLIHLGQLINARAHFEAALRIYAPYHHILPTDFGGQDARMFTRAWLAHTLSILGYPDQAKRWSDESIALAHELANPFNLMNAMAYRAVFHRRQRELEAAEEASQTFRKIAMEYGFAQQTAAVTIRQGIRLMRQGQLETGHELLQQGITAYRATGGVIRFPLYCISVIDVYRDAGQTAAGLSVVAEALDHSERTGEHWYDAELYRLKGELQFIPSLTDSSAAEACLRQALTIARNQQAKLWELRAATSLARLWQSQGKRQDAYKLLTPVYGWFTEGFNTADLKDARVLLDELEG